MISTVIELLKKSEAEAWEITDTHTEGLEFYFIRHELDQNRAKKTEHLNVTVYVRMDEESYGIASGEIYPTYTEKEIEEAIASLCTNAKYAKNRVYRLNERKEVRVAENNCNLYENASAFIKTLQSVHETETEFINSYEIFTSVHTAHFVNSNGMDVTETYPESMAEVIINARNSEHEIEVYRMYRSGTCDGDSMKKDIEKAMQYGHDRLNSVDTPNNLHVPVILSGNDGISVYRYLLSRINTGMIYQGISRCEKGTDLTPGRKGDPITVRSIISLPNSSSNHVIDEEGAVIEEKALIENNVAKHLTGTRRFSQYLGEDNTFSLTNWSVDAGTVSKAEIRNRDYLEIVEFSGLEISEMTGDIFGEIRLGYLHEGDHVTVVKGGSISGNIQDQFKDMLFSEELTQYNNVRIPSLTCLFHVTIAGCAK